MTLTTRFPVSSSATDPGSFHKTAVTTATRLAQGPASTLLSDSLTRPVRQVGTSVGQSDSTGQTGRSVCRTC